MKVAVVVVLSVLLGACAGSAQAPRAASSLRLGDPVVRENADQIRVGFSPSTRAVARLRATAGGRPVAVPPGVIEVDARGRLLRAVASTPDVKVTLTQGEIMLRPTAPVSAERSLTAPVLHHLVQSTQWTTVQGRPRLSVRLNDFARAAGVGIADAAWQQVLESDPKADRLGMADQFRCHLTFSPEKASYHLEPWRPAVGYSATVLAGCNPGPDGWLG